MEETEWEQTNEEQKSDLKDSTLRRKMKGGQRKKNQDSR